MSPATATPEITPDDLLTMPDGDHLELVHGIPVEKQMGAESDGIAARLLILVGQFVGSIGLGRVFGSQTGYRCFPHEPKLVRKPDVSFVATTRLPGGKVPRGDFLIAPDLAVEVVSPNDLAELLEEKLHDYRQAGIRLVWIVSPLTRTVQVRRPDGSAQILLETDMLSGEDVVPGFTCRIADLFT